METDMPFLNAVIQSLSRGIKKKFGPKLKLGNSKM